MYTKTELCIRLHTQTFMTHYVHTACTSTHYIQCIHHDRELGQTHTEYSYNSLNNHSIFSIHIIFLHTTIAYCRIPPVYDGISTNGGFLSHGDTPNSLDGLFHGKSQSKIDEWENRIAGWFIMENPMDE